MQLSLPIIWDLEKILIKIFLRVLKSEAKTSADGLQKLLPLQAR